MHKHAATPTLPVGIVNTPSIHTFIVIVTLVIIALDEIGIVEEWLDLLLELFNLLLQSFGVLITLQGTHSTAQGSAPTHTGVNTGVINKRIIIRKQNITIIMNVEMTTPHKAKVQHGGHRLYAARRIIDKGIIIRKQTKRHHECKTNNSTRSKGAAMADILCMQRDTFLLTWREKFAGSWKCIYFHTCCADPALDIDIRNIAKTLRYIQL